MLTRNLHECFQVFRNERVGCDLLVVTKYQKFYDKNRERLHGTLQFCTLVNCS